MPSLRRSDFRCHLVSRGWPSSAVNKTHAHSSFTTRAPLDAVVISFLASTSHSLPRGSLITLFIIMTDAPSAKKSPLLQVLPALSARSSKTSLRTPTPGHLSFYQRHFTVPVDSNLPYNADSASSVGSVLPRAVQADSSSSLAKEKAIPVAVTTPDTSRRKFSLLTKGALAVFLLGVLVIVIILAIVLPITLRQRQDVVEAVPDRTRSDPTLGGTKGGTNTSGNPLSPNAINDPTAYRYSKAPVRLALLTNFPDPSIYYDVNTSLWWAFGTNGNAGILNTPAGAPTGPQAAQGHANIQVATSTDFLSWVLHDALSDPLPNPGAWTRPGTGTPDSDSDSQGGDDRDPAATKTSASHVSAAKATESKHEPSSTAPADKPEAPSPDAAKAKRSELAVFHKAVVKGTKASVPLSIAAANEVPLANVWAPDVIKHPTQDKYLMYYSAVSAADPGKHHCIGASIADSPAGPYTPNSEPIACPVEKGGAIDPVIVVDPDDKRIYVVYKIDGNSIGHGGECNNGVAPLVSTPIMLQRMEDDGITKDDSFEAVQLLDRTKVDGPLIEAPAVAKVGEQWFMFYSSGCTRSPSYDVRYATAKNLTGPWTRHGKPLFKTDDYGLLAPGSVSVRWTQGDDSSGGTFSSTQGSETSTAGWKIALHARVRTDKGGVRSVFTAGLKFADDGSVSIISGVVGEPTSGGCTGTCQN